MKNNVTLVTQNNQGGTMHYTLKDHQGSLTATVHGNTAERLSYDAWGRRRNPVGFGYDNVAHTFDRGYTLHEHYDDFGLVNMNGRCYDPVTSHFLSVDAYVQQPGNSQGFNRYAYCMHNPLRYTDPTGWLSGTGRSDAPNLNHSHDETARWHSEDINDVLWGRSVHPCETGNPYRTNSTITTYSQANEYEDSNTNSYRRGPIIDPSQLTPEQQEIFNLSMEFAKLNSELFRRMYENLDNSLLVYQIKMGETSDDVPAQYDLSDNSITFRDESALGMFNDYCEELIHALQLSENKELYDPKIEFNYEYEAKVLKVFMQYEISQCAMNVVGNDSFEKTMKFLAPNGFDIILPTATTIDRLPFLAGYFFGAKCYSEWNILHNYGNSNYKKATLQKPQTIIKLFRSCLKMDKK